MDFYAMQKKAWMDEAVMMAWIEKCLLPWKDTLPPHAMPLLILDLFHVHMMRQVVKKYSRLESKSNTSLVVARTCANQLMWG